MKYPCSGCRIEIIICCFSCFIAGSYLYIDRDHLLSGVSDLSTYRALLVSRVLTYTQPTGPNNRVIVSSRCFSFWYHMSGQGPESCLLRVKVIHGQNSGDLGTTVWSQNARYSRTWKRVAVDINALTPYQVYTYTINS